MNSVRYWPRAERRCFVVTPPFSRLGHIARAQTSCASSSAGRHCNHPVWSGLANSKLGPMC
ncbi:hypothetical protein JMJ77_0005504 [Colletotrichum scovillei]|uniref:Uncharacterized protein n=1 Tax=Colletotrichum scovillei TaxID=1209932 RepID=A0A9P7RGV0_9PEZI|nr:hypothetical protein JMJ77_0005504 [Colletotrichum scovillei]KAG7076727.1 hypothetical protein JMJ76_0013987 [Colletotrichum scovillei]KAG7083775.1 hypothetical protein JMJ78_0009217 [Colletotrichum scovillei]